MANCANFSAPRSADKNNVFVDLTLYLRETETILQKWDAKVQKTLSEVVIYQDREMFYNFMKEYVQFLERDAEVLENTSKLTETVLDHINSIYSFYTELRLETVMTAPYLENMEDMMCCYCKLKFKEFDEVSQQRTCQKTISELTRSLCQVLNLYLMQNEMHISHVLLRIEFKETDKCRKVLEGVLTHFLLHLPRLDQSDEAFCRYYIIIQRWKKFREKKEHIVMEKIMYEKFKRTENDINKNPLLRKILKPPCENVRNLFSLLRDRTKVSRKVYFEYVNKRRMQENEPDFDSITDYGSDFLQIGDEQIRAIQKEIFNDDECIEIVNLDDDDVDDDVVWVSETKLSDKPLNCEDGIFNLDAEEDVVDDAVQTNGEEALSTSSPTITKDSHPPPADTTAATASEDDVICIDLDTLPVQSPPAVVSKSIPEAPKSPVSVTNDVQVAPEIAEETSKVETSVSEVVSIDAVVESVEEISMEIVEKPSEVSKSTSQTDEEPQTMPVILETPEVAEVATISTVESESVEEMSTETAEKPSQAPEPTATTDVCEQSRPIPDILHSIDKILDGGKPSDLETPPDGFLEAESELRETITKAGEENPKNAPVPDETDVGVSDTSDPNIPEVIVVNVPEENVVGVPEEIVVRVAEEIVVNVPREVAIAETCVVSKNGTSSSELEEMDLSQLEAIIGGKITLMHSSDASEQDAYSKQTMNGGRNDILSTALECANKDIEIKRNGDAQARSRRRTSGKKRKVNDSDWGHHNGAPKRRNNGARKPDSPDCSAFVEEVMSTPVGSFVPAEDGSVDDEDDLCGFRNWNHICREPVKRKAKKKMSISHSNSVEVRFFDSNQTDPDLYLHSGLFNANDVHKLDYKLKVLPKICLELKQPDELVKEYRDSVRRKQEEAAEMQRQERRKQRKNHVWQIDFGKKPKPSAFVPHLPARDTYHSSSIVHLPQASENSGLPKVTEELNDGRRKRRPTGFYKSTETVTSGSGDAKRKNGIYSSSVTGRPSYTERNYGQRNGRRKFADS